MRGELNLGIICIEVTAETKGADEATKNPVPNCWGRRTAINDAAAGAITKVRAESGEHRTIEAKGNGSILQPTASGATARPGPVRIEKISVASPRKRALGTLEEGQEPGCWGMNQELEERLWEQTRILGLWRR